MEFDGTITLDGATTEEVWIALSDPNLVWDALPGCVFLVRIEDEEPDFEALRSEYGETQPDLTADPDEIAERAFVEGGQYGALLELSVGSVKPSFRTTVTIEERDKPRMAATGEGSAGNSSFEMRSSMRLSEHEEGVDVEWNAEADVFGRIAQMGQRMINPVANRVIKRFFTNVQETLADLSTDEAAGEDRAANAEDATRSAGGREAENADGSSSRDGQRERGLLSRLKRLLGIGGYKEEER